jgi:hypothetical protein
MPEAAFPKPTGEVVTTLAEIFRHQRRSEIVELLESANASIEQINYDNWNGGTYTWALRLDVPVPLFASVEPRLEAIEKEIAAKLTHISRTYSNDCLDTVTITPLSSAGAAASMRFVPSDLDVQRIWPSGYFRLFLSHVSKHQAAVSKLKEVLLLRGIDAFVSHKDIQPSLEWEKEIELALRSMHALAALLTPDFHISDWADQEIGWAFGRGLLVLPVRLPTDPYGFAGKVQGIRGNLKDPDDLAARIVGALLANPQTHGEMRRALVSSFCGAKSFPMALALLPLVVKVTDFTGDEKAALRSACFENSQVSGAYGVPDAIFRTFGRPLAEGAKEADDVPF